MPNGCGQRYRNNSSDSEVTRTTYRSIKDWGQPNARLEVEVIRDDGSYSVEATMGWIVWFVRVWMRNRYRSTHFASTEYWQVYVEYMVEDFPSIYTHFHEYYETAGLADRCQWEIEEWEYSFHGGWQPCENMLILLD